MLLLGPEAKREAGTAGPTSSPRQLARLTELGPVMSPAVDPQRPPRALAPVVAEPGRAGIEASPLESLEGGIRPAPPQRIAIPAAGLDAVVEPVSSNGGTRVDVTDRRGEVRRFNVVGAAQVPKDRFPARYVTAPRPLRSWC